MLSGRLYVALERGGVLCLGRIFWLQFKFVPLVWGHLCRWGLSLLCWDESFPF